MFRKIVHGSTLALFIVGALAISAASQKETALIAPLLIENFDYTPGQLTTVSSGAWVNFSGTGNFIPVSATGLTYPNYPGSGVGNKIDIVSTGTSAEDAYRQFATQGVGTTTYAAFLVRVTNTTGLALNTSTTGDYFAGFLPSSSTTALNARVSIRLGTAADTFQLGIRATANNTAAAFSTTDLAVNTTHLVVISDQIVAGNANDVINMWINPAIGGTEPTPTLTQTTATTTDTVDVARLFIRQGTTTTPNASIDGIRVGTTWADATTATPPTDAPVDLNGDGRTDWTVTRNATGNPGGQTTWYTQYNGLTAVDITPWGLFNDVPVPEDYNGDGRDDIAVWRTEQSGEGTFYILNSGTQTVRVERFGLTGDDPSVVGDYNADGRADLAVVRFGSVYRWYYRTAPNAPEFNEPWGTTNDFVAPGDYDGDGRQDFVIQRNEGGQARFWIKLATGAVSTVSFGLSTDLIIPGDYDGDGKTDICVARNVSGQLTWFYQPSSGGAFVQVPFGLAASDTPVQGDYDGDGRTDIAVWRSGAAPTFYVNRSSGGSVQIFRWGADGDFPVASYNVH